MEITVSDATTQGQSELGSNDNEGVLRIPRSTSITGTSQSKCFISCPGKTLLWWGYQTAEMMYSTAAADWALFTFTFFVSFFLCSSFSIRDQVKNCSCSPVIPASEKLVLKHSAWD